MLLSTLNNNEKGIITKIKGRGAFRKRMLEMGFIRGKEITVIKKAPLQDPVEYELMGYAISLRKSEAQLIEVITPEEATNSEQKEYYGTHSDELLKTSAKVKSKTINIALAGNPNSGKTTIFNVASGSNEKVGNYSGVTVDAKTRSFKFNEYSFNIVDLPGTYSISSYTPEEVFITDHIINKHPDVVINVIDASNLERNLYLTTQLIDLDIKVIIALNMYDELEATGSEFDYEALSAMIGIPIIPTIGSKRKGIKELFSKAIEVYEDLDPIVRHIHINYGNNIEKAIKLIQDKIRINNEITDNISSRFLSIKLLENDSRANHFLSSCSNYNDINKICNNQQKKLESELGEDSETLITDSKYGFINGALKETYTSNRESRLKNSETIDNIITHKLFGFPIFIFFMWFMFQTTFKLGNYPMNWLNNAIGYISNIISSNMSDGPLKSLVIDGIMGGVGGVIVYLPNILILFFFISFMEDTGYMARAAFIMDKIMHKIGLHGKSFIPLLMGFGCNVPAIMATRTLENRSDRLITMLINPFMSCSAKLPVYVLLTAAFFPSNAGTILFSIYIIGIIMAIIMAIIFKKTLFTKEEAPFVMELPPYRMPTINSTLNNMWFKSAQYLKKMGGIILIASIIIWALGYYPNKTNELQKSYIGKLGEVIEPTIKPLGFDWKMGVCIITGLAAKEITVSSMGILYNSNSNNIKDNSLVSKLQTAKYIKGAKKGQNIFSPLVALSFMIFILLYFPCIASVTAIKNESGSWKWAAFAIVYTTSVAWITSFIIYQGGLLLGFN